MNALKSIAGYNLVAILVYSLAIRIVTQSDKMSIMLVSAGAIVIHVIVCIVVALAYVTQHNNKLARAWLLGAGIVLLVGFSACMGNAAL